MATTTTPTVVLSHETRVSLIAAATIAVGPATDRGHDDRVMAEATKLLLSCADGTRLAERLDLVANAKHFTGVVTGIFREDSSKRGVLTLKTGTERKQNGLPLGFEQVRTDRTDFSPAAKALCIDIRDNLIGHKVLVDVILEPTNDPDKPKVRVVVGVRDLGESDDPEVIELLAKAKANAA